MKILIDLVFSLTLEQMDLIKDGARYKGVTVPEYVQKALIDTAENDLAEYVNSQIT